MLFLPISQEVHLGRSQGQLPIGFQKAAVKGEKTSAMQSDIIAKLQSKFYIAAIARPLERERGPTFESGRSRILPSSYLQAQKRLGRFRQPSKVLLWLEISMVVFKTANYCYNIWYSQVFRSDRLIARFSGCRCCLLDAGCFTNTHTIEFLAITFGYTTDLSSGRHRLVLVALSRWHNMKCMHQQQQYHVQFEGISPGTMLSFRARETAIFYPSPWRQQKFP